MCWLQMHEASCEAEGKQKEENKKIRGRRRRQDKASRKKCYQNWFWRNESWRIMTFFTALVKCLFFAKQEFCFVWKNINKKCKQIEKCDWTVCCLMWDFFVIDDYLQLFSQVFMKLSVWIFEEKAWSRSYKLVFSQI